jgi:glycosyltransferase involved in cell wall biosynthesis
MKLVWFSHFIPFPPRGGHLQRSFNLIRQMSNSYGISLVALNFLGESAKQLRSYSDEMKKYCENVEIWELPHPWRGARWWAELLWSPVFRDPFSCRALFSKEILRRWEQMLRKHSGALLHLDSIDLALYASAANGFRKVLNHHNCESAMAYRRAQRELNPLKRTYLWLQARKLAHLEESICDTFDINVVVSEQDLRLLRANHPSAHIHVVENGVDIHHFRPESVEEEPRSLIFTGSLDWYPNLSAMRFLVREVWPHVRNRFPDARLYLAGKNPPEYVLGWTKEDSNIVVVANPDDMRPWLARAAVYVCPMLEGGGTRLKILDAMAMAKPVVSTTIGCEGLRLKHGENILVADAREEFAHKVVQLIENKELRYQMGSAGRDLVQAEYSWERIGQQLEQAYRCALVPGTCDQSTQERVSGTKGPR